MEEKQEPTCQQCGKRPASIHLTDFVDGQPVQRHLCEECYAEEEGMPPLSSSKIFAQLIGAVAPELQRVGDEECPECGINYLEFRQNLMLGCPNDYEVFSEALDDLLSRIHGADRHVGKVPRGAAQSGARQSRLQVLRRELQEAIEKEEFERAVPLRDEIQRLEQEIAGDTQG